MSEKPFRIAIAGLGTVGAGLVKMIEEDATSLTGQDGRTPQIVAVSAKNKDKDRGFDVSGYGWADKAEDLVDFNPDIVVEVIGGSDGPAYDLVKRALSKGIDVVTANKALLAHHGDELARLAEDNNAALAFEAAVAGGIPVIRALHGPLASDKIRAVYGILNGTCNYILTQMSQTGRDFNEVLQEAQSKGYAEADPAFDINGTDTGHKLALLGALAFGVRPHFDEGAIEGIGNIKATDIAMARDLGFKIKLLGIVQNLDGRLLQTVGPCLVPQASTLGKIDDVYNAVLIDAARAGRIMLSGLGAGEGPTASAVLSNIADLAHNMRKAPFGVPASKLKDGSFAPRGETRGSYYMRIMAVDRPGELAKIAAILGDHNISIASLLQREQAADKPVPVAITTHDVRHADIVECAEMIHSLAPSFDPPCLMRIEKDI